MARPVTPWIGKTDASMPPPRVRARIFLAHGGRCAITGREITPGDRWALDHTIALVNGGANAESNLRPVLEAAHKVKTAADVAEKTKVDATRKAHLGIKSRPTALSGPDREGLNARKAERSAARGAKPSLPPRNLFRTIGAPR